MHVTIIPRNRSSFWSAVSAGSLIVGLMLCVLCPRVFALPASRGVTVSPAQITMSIDKNETSAEDSVSVRNDYAQPLRFEASIRGIQQSGDGSLVPSTDIDRSLAATLSVTPRSFSLEPGQSINLRLVVTDSGQLSPGGHYASLFIRQANDDTEQQLSLSPAISVTIFLIKENGAIRDLSVSSAKDDGSLFRVPKNITLTFYNNGNVRLVPRASVSLRAPGGAQVKSGVVNQESLWVLPSGNSNLQAHLASLSLPWLPGRYTMHVLYRYDGSEAQKELIISRWVFPPLAAASCVIIGLGFAVVIRLAVLRMQRHRKQRRAAELALAELEKSRSIDGILKRPRKKRTKTTIADE